nr:type II toxin-antitoxin system ParD family antitoxin [Arenibacter certesii]
MSKNTSISLGNYFEEFVQNRIKEGRFKNVSEVIRAGLRIYRKSGIIRLKYGQKSKRIFTMNR